MTITDVRTSEHDEALRERVREVLSVTFMLDIDELPDDVSQKTCSRWTSLYHMTVLVALEEQFGVTFSTAEMIEMTSLPAIVGVLKHHGIQS
jgi:acyl carrier protein